MDMQCKHSGTMTIPPLEGEEWRVLPWCFYQRKKVEECPENCPLKSKPVYYE